MFSELIEAVLDEAAPFSKERETGDELAVAKRWRATVRHDPKMRKLAIAGFKKRAAERAAKGR